MADDSARWYKFNRRQFLGAGTATAAAGLLAACGVQGGETTPTVGAGSSPGSSELTGPIDLSFPEWLQPGDDEILRAITEIFTTKHPGVEPREVAVPFAQYHDQMIAQLAAGSPPDVIRIDIPQLPFYLEQDYLEPLDDVIAAAGVDPASLATTQQDTIKDGSTYALAYVTNPRSFIFNEQLYEEAGVGVPTTIEEFEEAIAATTDPSNQRFGLSIATRAGDTTGLFIQIMPFVIGMGGRFFRDGRPTVAEPQVVEALSFIKRLWDNNHIPRGLDVAGANTIMYEGQAASIISGAFIFTQGRAAHPDVAQYFQSAPTPLPSGTSMYASAWWGVPRDADKKEAGLAFVENLLDSRSQELVAVGQATIPVRPEFVTDEFISENPWFQVFLDNAEDAISYLPEGTGSEGFETLKLIGAEIEEILFNDVPVDEAMGSLQETLETQFEA